MNRLKESVFLVVVLATSAGAALVNAQAPTRTNAVTAEELVQHFRSLDPRAKAEQKPNGDWIIIADVPYKGDRVPVVVIVSDQGIKLRIPLGGPFDPARLSEPDRAKLNKLHRRGTQFFTGTNDKGHEFLIADQDLPRNVTLSQVRSALSDFLQDLEETEPVWGPIMDAVLAIVLKKS
jgi:hypothetical protein